MLFFGNSESEEYATCLNQRCSKVPATSSNFSIFFRLFRPKLSILSSVIPGRLIILSIIFVERDSFSQHFSVAKVLLSSLAIDLAQRLISVASEGDLPSLSVLHCLSAFAMVVIAVCWSSDVWSEILKMYLPVHVVHTYNVQQKQNKANSQ